MILKNTALLHQAITSDQINFKGEYKCLNIYHPVYMLKK